MIKDSVRMNAYIEALRRTVNSSTSVLDIGTGPGVMAFAAAKHGARAVYAIEPNDVIILSEQLAADNDLQDRINFYRAVSTEIELPEPVDVIISDLRGTLPLYGQHILSIIDARERFLKEGGILIPRQDALWVGPIEAQEHYQSEFAIWQDGVLGINLRSGNQYVSNNPSSFNPKLHQMLAQPQVWATLDYRKIASPHASGQVACTVTRSGTAHGLAVWFDAELLEGVGFSNAPGQPETVYGRTFFPWPEPVALEPGDQVEVSIDARLVGDSYTWTWNSTVIDGADAKYKKATFRQSTFLGALLSTQDLQKQHAQYRPLLNSDGLLIQAIISRFDGQTPLDEIATALMGAFPGRFKNFADSLGYVGKIAKSYS